MSSNDVENAASPSLPRVVDPQGSSLAELNRTVWSRRSEFTTSRQIRVKIGTWNVAATQGTEKDVAGWFVHGKGVIKDLSGLENNDAEGKDAKVNTESIDEQESRRTTSRSTLPVHDPKFIPGDGDIGLYVLGLQEIVDVSSPTEVVRPYHDKAPGERWKSAVLAALPRGYSLVAEQQLIGLYILVYATKKIADSISNVSCRSIGTGLMGTMGNKGAVSIRLILGETTKLVFINSHLAAGAQAQNVERRNWDADQIVSRTRFDAIDRGNGVVDEIGDSIGDEDFGFWFGDLNYRLADLPGDDIRRLLMRHIKENYEEDAAAHGSDLSQASKAALENSSRSGASSDSSFDEESEADLPPEEDPASLETTLASLIPHDELGEQMRQQKAFHQGWREGKIRFMPTYKYDVGSMGMFDTSEKRRAPSWCDRILYRSRKNYMDFKAKVGHSDHAIDRLSASARLDSAGVAGDYDEYDPGNDAYDSNTDGDRIGSGSNKVALEIRASETGSRDDIELEYYTSHQRVLSSDHKPLDAIFNITYTAVDLDRKSAVYQEVARDFDRRENESRPSLSVAVDTPEGKSSDELIDFGNARLGQSISKTLTVANTGQVDALFGFVLHNQAGSKRPWLHIDCGHQPIPGSDIPEVEDTFRIAPGDAWTATVTFHVVQPAVARQIRTHMEEVLLLRVLGGKDHFLTLRAEWQRTTVGLSIPELIRLPDTGVRSGYVDEKIKCSAPRELFRLTEALEGSLERAVAEWSMKGDPDSSPPWAEYAWPFEGSMWMSSSKADDLVQHLQESLDTCQILELPSLSPLQKTELYAKIFVRFVDSIDDGIITKSVWSQLRESMIAFEKIKKPSQKEYDEQCVHIFETVASSTPHNISFQLILTMLRRISNEIALSHSSGFASEQGHQKQTRENLRTRYAKFFQDIVFRPKAGDEGNVGKEATRNEARRTLILDLCIEERPVTV